VTPSHIDARPGETVAVSCTTTSNENVVWFRQNSSAPRAQHITNGADGKVLKELQNKYRAEKVGEKEYRLTINIQKSDEGYIICKQSNTEQVIANMTLTVSGTDIGAMCTILSLAY